MSEQLLSGAASGEFKALVDTGALIMGLTNREIASALLNKLPTKDFQAVVYIDDAG